MSVLTNAEAVEIDLRPARLGSRALALVFDILTQIALVLRKRPVHVVDVKDVGLAGLQAGFEDALP